MYTHKYGLRKRLHPAKTVVQLLGKSSCNFFMFLKKKIQNKQNSWVCLADAGKHLLLIGLKCTGVN